MIQTRVGWVNNSDLQGAWKGMGVTYSTYK